jgi:hypothetical protein
MANSYPRPIKLRGMTSKIESVYGTDPTPATTDAVRIRGPLRASPKFAFPNMREETVIGSIIGEAPPGIPQGLAVEFDVDVELTGAGAAYSATVLPQCHTFLVGSGMGAAVVTTGGSESVTYTMADTGHGSFTCWLYTESGKLIKVNGCRSTWSIPITAGELGVIRCTISGFIAAPITGLTEADLAALSYDSVVPPAAVGTALVIVNSTDTWDPPRFGSATLTAGANVVRLDDAADATNGIEMFAIPEIKPTFEVVARAVDLATYDYVTARGYGTSATPPLPHTIDLTIGSVQYNRVDVDINVAYLEEYPDDGDDNGFASGTFKYRCNDLVLVFD